MTPQQALDILGLVGTPDLTKIDASHRARVAEADTELQNAADESTKHAWIQRKASLSEAYSILMRQTLGGVAVASSSTSQPTFQPPSGLSATMMADLPGAHPYQTALGTGGNLAQIASLQPGHVLANRFEIKAQIGAGGMGAVYRAHDRNRGEDIAVKVMLPGLIASDVAKQRFLNEAKIAIKLGHQHIVNTYDVQMDGAYIFITMELLEGTNLRQLMTEKKNQHQQWSETEVLNIIRPLCEALGYAHQYTIHRDIKPENVWINRNGSIKLMDFGIARLMTDSQMTQTSAVLGTAYYMAPEQLVGAKHVDHRADQYSVGVMVYELLTERIPTGRFKPLNEIRNDISEGLSDAVDQALAGHPQDRYADMAAFAQGLEQIGKGRKKGTRSSTNKNDSFFVSAQCYLAEVFKEPYMKRVGIGLMVMVLAMAVSYPFLSDMLEMRSARELADVEYKKSNYPTKAFELYRELANRGDAHSQRMLGAIYLYGRGVPKNSKQAAEWYRKAADQGNSDAQWTLGFMTRSGNGVSQDDQEAMKWFRLSAAQGEASRQNDLGTFYSNGTGVTKDDQEAVKWFRLSAEQDNKFAQFNLGIHHEYGRGITQDKKEAKKWYRLAAAHGFDGAKEALERLKDVEENSPSTNKSWAIWYLLLVGLVALAFTAFIAREFRRTSRKTVVDEGGKSDLIEGAKSVAVEDAHSVLGCVNSSNAMEDASYAIDGDAQLTTEARASSAAEDGSRSVVAEGATPSSRASEKIRYINLKWVGTGLAVAGLVAAAGYFLTGASSFRDCPDCPEMVVIPPGIFVMGSDIEYPIHTVNIDRAFGMGITEVTQGQWRGIMGNNPSFNQRCGADCPVENVSWNDIQEFIQKLNAKTGKQYRLPSEAEWEYACRAGSRYKYCGGDSAENLGWLKGNSGTDTHSVGGKQPNAFGLHDMVGNVSELVQDSWHDFYEGAPVNGNAWEGEDTRRVLRGSGALSDGLSLDDSLPSFRLYQDKGVGSLSLGFRLALSQPPQAITWHQIVALLLVLVGITSAAKIAGEKSRSSAVEIGTNSVVESGENSNAVENTAQSWIARARSRYNLKWVLGAVLGLVGLVWLSYPYVLAKYEEHVAAVSTAGIEFKKQRSLDLQTAKNEFADSNYEAALKLYAPLAEQGEAEAQNTLGWMYMNGKGVPQDFYMGFKWYLLAADQGLTIARYNLGLVFQNDVRDKQEAVKWYRLAAAQGDVDAQKNLEGIIKKDGEGAAPDNEQAVTWYLILAVLAVLAGIVFYMKIIRRRSRKQVAESDLDSVAERDIPRAWAAKAIKQLNLKWAGGTAIGLIAVVWLFYPYMYIGYVKHVASVAAVKAEIVKQRAIDSAAARKELDSSNYELAAKLYTPLAKQGEADAQTNLGWMYLNGNGVAKNFNEATRLFRLAAEQGEPTAQNNLGWMYESGDGVPQDTKLALKWYRLSADQGDSSAVRNLGNLYFEGKRITQDYNEAAKWYRVAADKGNAFAQFRLGWIYDQGLGVQQDRSEAARWYRLAAEQGDSTAQFNLGTFYRSGSGVPQDLKEAEKWYRLAAAQGDADAKANLEKLQPKKVKSQPKQVKPIAAVKEQSMFNKLFGR